MRIEEQTIKEGIHSRRAHALQTDGTDLNFVIYTLHLLPPSRRQERFYERRSFKTPENQLFKSYIWRYKWLTGQTRLPLVKIRKLWPSKHCSNEYVFQRPPFSVWKQGGGLYRSLSALGWFSIKCHLLLRMFLGTDGRYSVTNSKLLLHVFCLFCRADFLSLNLISERVFSKKLSG